MDDKGQVYFRADDKEIPEEDASRYEEALEAYREGIQRHVEELQRRAESSDRHYCRTLRIGELPDEGPWIPERAEVEEALRDEGATADRAREQTEK